MSPNKYRPHVLFLPEDGANKEIANGFLLHPSLLNTRLQILHPAGGWLKVLSSFESDLAKTMREYPPRYIVLLIDFDEKEDRMKFARSKIPKGLRNRVFVFGVKSEPEYLKREKLGSLEKVGRDLANDCYEGTSVAWSHALLAHNSAELERARRVLWPILFEAT